MWLWETENWQFNDNTRVCIWTDWCVLSITFSNRSLCVNGLSWVICRKLYRRKIRQKLRVMMSSWFSSCISGVVLCLGVQWWAGNKQPSCLDWVCDKRSPNVHPSLFLTHCTTHVSLFSQTGWNECLLVVYYTTFKGLGSVGDSFYSHSHSASIYLIRNTVKAVILCKMWSHLNCFLFYNILKCKLFLWWWIFTPVFSVARSFRYPFWWFSAEESFRIIINVENSCAFFWILWWIESSKEQHLSWYKYFVKL